MTDLLSRPVRIDYKALLVDLAKLVIGIGTGNVTSALKSGVDVAAAFGLDLTPDPHAQAAALVAAALNNAVVELVRGHTHLFAYDIAEHAPAVDPDDAAVDLVLDRDLFDHPERAPHVEALHPALIAWFVARGLDPTNARTVTVRLGHYYAAALAEEWRDNAATYIALADHLDSRATPIEERRRDWRRLRARLARRPQEPLFADSVALAQVYQPLRAWYAEPRDGDDPLDPLRAPHRVSHRETRRVVVDVMSTLSGWLRESDPRDAIRVIAGGPGAGKSSLAKMIAASRDADSDRVLLIELHRFDLTGDLASAINRFGRDVGRLRHDVLAHLDADPLLLIFDGLDELAIRGSAGRHAVGELVSTLTVLLARLNHDTLRVRALLLGRQVVVQGIESHYRRPGQILTLLPYLVPAADHPRYHDPDGRLRHDQRDDWWRAYGTHTARPYTGRPPVLDKVDALTAEPLLNYLVALTLDRGVDFADPATSLTDIYRALLDQVFRRVHACPPTTAPTRSDLTDVDHRLAGLEPITDRDFQAFLRIIAVVAWHTEGRTATLDAVRARAPFNLLAQMDTLTRGAEDALSRLVAAFYFRRSGDAQGAPETFEFTHQSFAEYLVADEILTFIGDLVAEAEQHRASHGRRGWSLDQQLTEWARLFGPAALEPNIIAFIDDGLRRRARDDKATVIRYGQQTSALIRAVLTHDFPTAALPPTSHLDGLLRASRNAGEALLVISSRCAVVGEQRVRIEGPEPTRFGRWLRRLQGQWSGVRRTLALEHLCGLDLDGVVLCTGDLFDAALEGASLAGAELSFAVISAANLSTANLSEAYLDGAKLEETNLSGANLSGANLSGATLLGANLSGANLLGANLRVANLEEANLSGTNLSGANLSGANLEGADLEGADLTHANVTEEQLRHTHGRPRRRRPLRSKPPTA